MSLVVVDASTAAKWLFEEEHSDAARRLRTGSFELHAPDFLNLELAGLITKNHRRGVLAADEAVEAHALVETLPIRRHPWASLTRPAFALALETRRALYDCLYLALAIALDGRVATADRKFFDALADCPFAAHLIWIEDVPTSLSTED